MAQRGLLGVGKIKDFDLNLNSKPFADIPDDEVGGDLEMLMREMLQAPRPRADPAAAPRAQTVRQRTSACGPYVSVVCVVLLCCGSCVAVCAPGVVVLVVVMRLACVCAACC
jgi:hypothetical protein